MKHITFTISGRPAESPPRCPGVYRFLDSAGQALYIGKSINLRDRIRTHLGPQAPNTRQHRLLRATERVDCRPTAGEAGALLLENAAIKQELPQFNRRQRALRRLWSITLEPAANDYLRAELCCFADDAADIRAAYGHFGSRYHARRALERLARAEMLCPLTLGLESGRGPCFQRQIGRCRGACVGEETAAEHNARLLQALESRQLAAWPCPGPVLLREAPAAPLHCQPAEEWHLLHNWMYLGTFTGIASARRASTEAGLMFDRDTYRILRGVLRDGEARLFSLDTGDPVAWADAAS